MLTPRQYTLLAMRVSQENLPDDYVLIDAGLAAKLGLIDADPTIPYTNSIELTASELAGYAIACLFTSGEIPTPGLPNEQTN